MLDITNKDDYKSSSIHKNLIIEFADGSTLDNPKIYNESMRLNEILMEDNQLHFGRCNSSEFSIILGGVSSNIKGSVISPYFEVNGVKMPLGIYTITFVEQSSQKAFKQITALDNMHKIDRDVTKWYSNLTFPMTQKAFRDSFFEYIGLDQVETTLLFDDLVLNNPFADVGQINGRTIAEGLCELNATFGHCDREGKFKYVGLKYDGLYPSDDLYPADDVYPGMLKYPSDSNEIIEDLNNLYIKASYDEFETQFIERILIIDDYGSQLANSDDTTANTYVINNNYLLYGREKAELLDIMNRFQSVVRTQSYRPASIESKGLPYIELGDRVKVNVKDDEILTYVFNRTLTGIQALRDTYSAEGEEYLINDLNSLQTKIDSLNRTTDRLKIEVTQTSEGLKSKVSKGNVSTEISQESDEVRITGNRFVVDADNLSISKEGKLTANEAELTGNITASSFISKLQTGVIEMIEKADTYQAGFFTQYKVPSGVLYTAEYGSNGLAVYKYDDGVITTYPSQGSWVLPYQIHTSGDLSVSGTKSRQITTPNYGNRLEYCYEMPTPYFGDIGEGITDNDGICYIFLDDIFAETIDTNCEYQVFLQAYDEGTVYVNRRNSSYFVVKGTPNMRFAWEIKAVQRDYEMYRLDESKQQAEETTDYAEESYDYLASLLYDVEQESEVIINE